MELVRVGERVREVKPEGEVEGGAVRAAGGEDGVAGPDLAGALDRPSEEDVGDDACGWFSELIEEVFEGGLEGLGGLEEGDEEVGGDGVGVFGVGGEAVGRAGEGEGGEMEGGDWREGGSECLDVEWGADKGDDGVRGEPLD